MAHLDAAWPPLPSVASSPPSASTVLVIPPPSPPASTASVTPSPSSALTPTAIPFAPLPPLSSPMPQFPSPLPTNPLLYSPSASITASPLDLSQTGMDFTLHELRAHMAYCMDRFRTQEEHIAGLTASLRSVIAHQDWLVKTHASVNQQKDLLISKLSEDLARLTSQVHTAPPPAPDTQIQEQIATIQTEIERHSEWVEVARKEPPRAAMVAETLAESKKRTQRALNLRVRGIEKVASTTPLQQAVEFVTQTMDIADHGIVAAHRAGGDPSRPQPLIMRFRDAEARLAVLRRRRRLSGSPQIHLDEDLTPFQWEVYRALLPHQRSARQEGLWAVIRDGRLITRPLRTTRRGPDDGEPPEDPDGNLGRQSELGEATQ